jgi:hypothetical protein
MKEAIQRAYGEKEASVFRPRQQRRYLSHYSRWRRAGGGPTPLMLVDSDDESDSFNPMLTDHHDDEDGIPDLIGDTLTFQR